MNDNTILILTQCFPPVVGGIENYVGGMALALAHRHNTVVFADTPAADNDANAPYTIRRFGGIKFIRRRYKCFAARRLLCGGGEWRVFCDSWKSLEYLSPPASVKQITVLAHGTEFPQRASEAKKQRIQTAMAKATRILAVSDATRARMEKCGINSAAIQIWPPPIEPPEHPAAADIQTAARHWRQGSPKLLTVARLVERKGIDIALQAVAQLKPLYPNIRYIIAGSGREEEKLHRLTDTLQLQDNVKFLGTVTGAEKSALHTAADMFLLPCREVQNDVEGYGMVFIEAAFFGVPSVVGIEGGAADAVEDGRTGFHCDGRSTEAVCGAIQKFINLPADEQEKMREHCRQKAAANLWRRRVNQLLE